RATISSKSWPARARPRCARWSRCSPSAGSASCSVWRVFSRRTSRRASRRLSSRSCAASAWRTRAATCCRSASRRTRSPTPRAAASAIIVAAAALSAAGLVSGAGALAWAIVAALVLLLYIGERPLLAPDAPRRDQLLGAAVGLVWLAVCYLPFYTRIFPGAPLVDAVEVKANG